MKTLTKIIAVLLLTVTPFILTAQPELLDENVGNGAGANFVGGGAPFAGGFLILLSLGIGYGAKKVYDYRKRILE